MCDNHLISRKAWNVWNVLLTPQTGKFHFSFGTAPLKTIAAKVWLAPPKTQRRLEFRRTAARRAERRRETGVKLG